MNPAYGIIAFALIVVLGPMFYFSRKAKGEREAIRLALMSQPGFTAGDMVMATYIGIALDPARELLGLALRLEKDISVFLFPYAMLTGVDLEIDDGSSFTSKTGFVSFSTDTVIRSVNIVITLRDKEVPVIRISLYSFGQQKPDALSVMQQRDAIELGRRWQANISSIVRSQPVVLNSEVVPIPSALSTAPALSIATEIAQLHQLHQEGALTKDEFESAKLRLLTR
jgi:hypothetical protein